MFKNVLVGIDDRQGGRDAIALATHLVDASGKLTLLNVHSGVLRPIDAASPGAVSAERERSHTLLEGRARTRRRTGRTGQRRLEQPR